MTTTPSSIDPVTAWKPYRPSDDAPWNVERVVRMHRRAGLGAAWAIVERDLAEGPEAAIARVLDGEKHLADGRSPEEIQPLLDAMMRSLRQSPSIDRLESWWVFRAALSPFPLEERMAMAWHVHYATNQDKVNSAAWMADQHLKQRELWRGPMRELHLAMLRDAAMLKWLDGVDSVKGRPNENLGREFLELFALGEGNYTERDVREAARALTGWRQLRDQSGDPIRFVAAEHDDEPKTILGETGRWNEEDLVRIACSQEAAPRHIARRLWRTLVSDTVAPTDELLAPLAEVIAQEGDVRAGIETIVRSRLFHAPDYVATRVLSPFELVLGTMRACEIFPPQLDLTAVRMHMARMGQRLFHPPSVAGWPDGLAWLRGPTALARLEFAKWAATIGVGPERLAAIAERGGASSHEAQLDYFAALLVAAPLTSARRAEILSATADAGDAGSRCAAIVRYLLTLPEAQVV